MPVVYLAFPRGEVAERRKAAVCYTESRLSTTLDCPRNSFHVFDFSDSTIWLLLALRFCLARRRDNRVDSLAR